MKIILTVIFCLSLLHGYSQDCKTEAANKPSVLVRFQDDILKPTNGSKVTINRARIDPLLGKAESWEKGILKNFTGAKLAYSNDYFFDLGSGGFTDKFYKATGIKGFYSSKMRFYAYYCYDNDNKIHTEAESGSFLEVIFNNVFATSLCTDVGVFTINGKYAFEIFEKGHTEGRVDYYEQIAYNNVEDQFPSKHDFIIIRNSDLPVFIPITRKEYLDQMLKDIDTNRESQIAFAKSTYDPKNEVANKAEFDAALKRMDNSKNYTPQQMEAYRNGFIKNWETEKQKLDKQIARIETETKGAKEVVLEFQKKPQEWLNRSITLFYPYSSYTAKGLTEYFEHLDVFALSSDQETRTQIVSLNPAYFNKSLGADVPQLIMVHLPKGSYPHMQKVADLVKQPGALAPLVAILSPGKQQVDPLPSAAITSTYTLSWLPKLTNLSPLIVPAGMKPSIVPIIPANKPPTAKLNFETPALSPKLKLLPAQPFTTEAYNNFVQELYAKISGAIKPEEKEKADEYLKNKKLTQSNDIGNAALAAWLQNTPKASLYLYSKAVAGNPSDALAANNFSAFLMMGGLPEKSIPILEYWNKLMPGESTILSNLGNAYYRLGDMTKAMKYLQQCVQKDSLNPTANKILCMMYLKKGDVKKAEIHGVRSIATCIDEQVIAILNQLNNKVKPGDIMSGFPPMPEKEFPMLERIKLPTMPAGLDDMEQFAIELDAIKKSVKMTIAAIEAGSPEASDEIQQKILMASFTKGMSSIRLKAQYIIMDGMQTYQNEKIQEADVFAFHLKKMNISYTIKVKGIQNKYNDRMKTLEGGEGGDEDVIAALELAKCNELNGAAEIYLAGLSRLTNQYAARQEFVSRKFFRDYANWAPYWMPATTIPFPSIERDYLKDVLNILGEYVVLKKTDCSIFEPLPGKDGTLQKWEDEYCANFKGKIGAGPAKVYWNCNGYGMEAGEGIVGGFDVNYSDDGEFKDVSFLLGVGASWNMGAGHIAQIGAGASAKEFVKIGPDKETGDWGVKDAGIKGEVSIEGEIAGNIRDINVIQVTAGYTSGVNVEGAAVPILNLK